MRIYIRCFFSGMGAPLEFDSNEKFINVKRKIQEVSGLMAKKQRLIFEENQLDNNYTISQYGISLTNQLYI